MPRQSPIRIGISACLLGERVRYDGGHKRSPFLIEILGPHVQWVPVCPEVEVGMGTPREPMHLLRTDRGLRMFTTRGRVDYTDAMNSWAGSRLDELCKEDLSGYILKSKSPSCGKQGVAVYRPSGRPDRRVGRGLFAATLMARLPNLPVEQESELNDERARDHFVERVFAYRRLKDLFARRWTLAGLVRFHAANRLALSLRSSASYRELEGIVRAEAGTRPSELRDRYERGFMAILSRPVTRARHVTMLRKIQHALGSSPDAASLRQAIAEYSRARVPIAVPIGLVRELVLTLGDGTLTRQSYIDWDARELALRRHV